MEKAMESSVLTLRINKDTKDKLDKLASACELKKEYDFSNSVKNPYA